MNRTASGGRARGRTTAFTGAVVVLALSLAVPPPVLAASDAGEATAAAHAEFVTESSGHLRLLIGWRPDAHPLQRTQALTAAGLHGAQRVTTRVDAVTVAPGLLDAAVRRLTAHAAVASDEVDRWLYPAQAAPPDDPGFPDQWGLHNTGATVDDTATTAGIDVRALDAWEVTRGDPDVVVAVIDSGVDIDHPDLADALWVNEGEVADGTDTDGNGFADDVHGWNFVGEPAQESSDLFVSTTEDWHGTAVAGVIAAQDNDLGIVGLAPETRVMVLKAFSLEGEALRASLTDILEAIEYATDMGADVINASWFRRVHSPALEEAIRTAGVPVATAAGNDQLDLEVADPKVFPVDYTLPNLVSVTAVAPDGQLPAFANYGRSVVDVVAPGLKILTTYPDDWHYLRGTSFAAPLVSAALALALTSQPDIAVADLVDAVSWTSRVVPGAAGTTISGGMLDAGALLRGIQRPICGPAADDAELFADVDPANTHADALRCLRATGVAEGDADGRFVPAGTITRAQLASFIARSLEVAGVDLPTDPPDAFVDDDGSTHEPAINRLAALDIARGDETGRFEPAAAVTRGQLAALAVRAHAAATGGEVAASRNWFTDDDRSTHATAIDAARDLGLVRGVATLRFAPAASSRRDQVASLVARLLDSVARHGGGDGGTTASSDARDAGTA